MTRLSNQNRDFAIGMLIDGKYIVFVSNILMFTETLYQDYKTGLMPEKLRRIGLEIEIETLMWLHLDMIGSFNVYIYKNVQLEAFLDYTESHLK